MDTAAVIAACRRDIESRTEQIEATPEEKQWWLDCMGQLLATPGLDKAIGCCETFKDAYGLVHQLMRFFTYPDSDLRNLREVSERIAVAQQTLGNHESLRELYKGSVPEHWDQTTEFIRRALENNRQFETDPRTAPPIRPEHIGTRGGASKMVGANRGIVTRALHDLIPSTTPNRNALIAKLMEAFGWPTTKQAVRATITADDKG